MAVRRARAMADTIGFTPEQLGIPLASAIHTPVLSCSSPFGFATEVWVTAQLCAAHLVGTEYRRATPADRDPVDLVDERLEVLAALPRRKRLARQKSAARPRPPASGSRSPRPRGNAAGRARRRTDTSRGLPVLVDGDPSGAAVLDDERPVGPVPIFAGEFFVLRAVEPGHDGGKQAGEVLHAFDDVTEAVIHFGELVHDSGHRGAVPRVLGFVIDSGDEAGGV